MAVLNNNSLATSPIATVTCDGSKDSRAMMYELAQLIDLSKITAGSRLCFDAGSSKDYLDFRGFIDANTVEYIGFYTGNPFLMIVYRLNKTDSTKCGYYINPTNGNISDSSSVVRGSGMTFSLFY